MIRDRWRWHRAWRGMRRIAATDPGLGACSWRGREGRLYAVGCEALRDPAALQAALGDWRARLPQAGEVLSRTRSHTVYRLETAAYGPVVLKRVEPTKPHRRYAIPSLFAGWRLHRALPGSVPRPLGALERYGAWGQLQEAWLLARYEPGRSLRARLGDPGQRPATELARALGAYLARVHDAGVLFRDAHPENVLVRAAPSPDEPRFSLIDLDALLPGRPSPLERLKLLKKLELPEPEQGAMVAAYWQTTASRPLPLLQGFLERVYYPVKRVRRRWVAWLRSRCASSS